MSHWTSEQLTAARMVEGCGRVVAARFVGIPSTHSYALDRTDCDACLSKLLDLARRATLEEAVALERAPDCLSFTKQDGSSGAAILLAEMQAAAGESIPLADAMQQMREKAKEDGQI